LISSCDAEIPNMNGRRPHLRLATVASVTLCTVLLQSSGLHAAAPPPAAGALPEGVSLNAATGTYGVHRRPARSLEAVLKSIAQWRHQVLADESTADFSAEDGILAMECSACGLTAPSAIEISAIDLDSVVAYEAGSWHIGIRSKDGTQDFFGVMRGELGPEPHDPQRSGEDRRVALAALADLYDLAYLTQNPQAPPAAAAAAPVAAAPRPAPPAASAAGAPPPPAAPAPAPPAAANARQGGKPGAGTLAELAAAGNVEAIQDLRGKARPAEVAHALELAYGVRARAQMLGGQVDGALETLAAGRQTFGKSAALRDLEAHYVVIGNAYDRLRLAVKLDAGEIQPYLQQIRTLEPADVGAVEQMLASVLANRIADQRAAGREQIAGGLLAAGRTLFPAFSVQLGQGKAGALGDAGGDAGAPPPTDR
jgi:hypothetical protein